MSQDENFDLEATCRELTREKSRLGSKVRTLGYELNETRLKLEEKTAEYESLKRKMDDSKNHPTLPQHYSQGECQDHSHVTLVCRIQAAESRKTVLEREIEAAVLGKAEIIREMDEMKRKHEDQVLQFTQEIQNMEQLLAKERSHFEIKYNEIKVVVRSQHAYITELEASFRKKEKEHEAWAAKFHGQIKHFMTDALEAITAGEEQRHAIVNKKNEVDEKLKETQNSLESLKDEMNSYRQTVASIFTKATEILKGNMNSLSEINQNTSETEGIIEENKEKAELQEFTVDNELDSKLEVEQFMKRFFNHISLSQNVYLNQIQRLYTRIQELEKSAQLENSANSKQYDILLKKCRHYNKLIKRLNITISEMTKQNLVSTETPTEIKDEQKVNRIMSEVEKEALKEEKLKWNKLKENHSFFESILREIDDTLDDEISFI